MRIKELREEKNISQLVLAEKIGTSQRNIGRWENGENEPSYSQLVKLADFFNVTLDYLVNREDDFGNVTVVNTERDALTRLEKRLLTAFAKLDADEKDKLIYDAEYFAGKHDALRQHAQNKPLIG